MTSPVPRLRRLLSIIPLIQRRGGISLQELRQTLGVSDRELQGDLKAIMLCGVPPYLPNDYISVFIDGDHVTVDYAEHFARPARLTLREALALRLAIARLQVPEDGPLYDAYIELLEALDDLVLGEDMAALEGRIEATQPGEASEKVLSLDQAIAAQLPVDLTYYSPSSEQVRVRRVHPYGRGDKGGNHYLIAYCEQAQGRRTFRLDRISRIAPVNGAKPFELPPGFDLSAAIADIGPPKAGDRMHHLSLRFDEAIARFAADEYSEQRVEEAPDGDVVVHMTCGSIPWAVNRCLHYGELAEILEPEEARQALVARLEAFLES